MDDGGLVGVALFFTLSGFLITTLLMEEWTRHGRIDLLAFYARRAIRLFPALIAVVAVCVALGFPLHDGAMVLLYLSDFMVASGNLINPLTHTWSLAVEEQFYLIAPIALVLVRGRWRGWAIGAAAVVIGIWAWRFGYWTSVEESVRWIYNGPTRIDGILVGCILAVWFRFRGEWKPRLWAVIPAWAFLLWYGSGFWSYGWSYFTVGMIGLQVASVIVTAWAVTFTGKWLSWSPLLFVGKISYGLYLWHYLVFVTPQVEALPQPMRSVVEWAGAFALAIGSWYLLEQPISKRFKGSFDRRSGPKPALPRKSSALHS
jgi:peptidoglycan/LPS O-acetylase OafA/YrhL